jgi:hypothetical protein
VERAWVVIAAVLAGAVGVVILGALMAPGSQDDIWVELVSRATQLIVLALAGGVVGAVIHDRDAAREDERRRVTFLLAFVGEIETAYGHVKTARRLVRTYGFDIPRDTPLTAEQVEGFRTQLALLNEAQLHFETLARKVEALPEPFGDAHAAIAAELSAIHGYLNGVLKDWQTDSTSVVVGGDTRALAGWARFGDFVGYADGAELAFNEGVADRVVTIELLIHRLGTSPA